MVRPFAAVSAAFAFELLTGSVSAAETYIIDPVHSQPMFEVQHMVGDDVRITISIEAYRE